MKGHIDKPFCCNFCQLMYTTKDNRTRHIELRHSREICDRMNMQDIYRRHPRQRRKIPQDEVGRNEIASDDPENMSAIMYCGLGRAPSEASQEPESHPTQTSSS